MEAVIAPTRSAEDIKVRDEIRDIGHHSSITNGLYQFPLRH